MRARALPKLSATGSVAGHPLMKKHRTALTTRTRKEAA